MKDIASVIFRKNVYFNEKEKETILKEFLENIKKDKRFVGKKNKEDNFS